MFGLLPRIVGMVHSEESAAPTRSPQTVSAASVVGLASYLDYVFKLGENRLRPIVDKCRGAAGEDEDDDLTGFI